MGAWDRFGPHLEKKGRGVAGNGESIKNVDDFVFVMCTVCSQIMKCMVIVLAALCAAADVATGVVIAKKKQ